MQTKPVKSTSTYTGAMPSSFTLEEVRTNFDKWRQDRQKKGKLPEFLWQQALNLLNKYNKSDICRELKISGGQINDKIKLQSSSIGNPSLKPNFVSINVPEVVEKFDLNNVSKIDIKFPNGIVLSAENLNQEILIQLLSQALEK